MVIEKSAIRNERNNITTILKKLFFLHFPYHSNGYIKFIKYFIKMRW